MVKLFINIMFRKKYPRPKSLFFMVVAPILLLVLQNLFCNILYIYCKCIYLERIKTRKQIKNFESIYNIHTWRKIEPFCLYRRAQFCSCVFCTRIFQLTKILVIWEDFPHSVIKYLCISRLLPDFKSNP